MKFLKALWTNTLKILMVLTFAYFPFIPTIAMVKFNLNPYFILLFIPLAIIEFTFIDCYANKLDVFCEKHNISWND